MKQYQELLDRILNTGVQKGDRTGTGTLSVFGHQMRFDLADGFPLLTTKKLFLRGIIHELLWFLKGETNIRYLKENNVSIWDDWVKIDTAEYEAKTSEELEKEILKAMGYNWASDKIDEISELPEGTEDLVRCEIAGLSMNQSDNYDVKNISFSFSPESWKEIVKEEISDTRYSALQYVARQLGIPTKKLVGGELGPVYGSQWRSWPDPSKARQALQAIRDLPSARLDEASLLTSEGLEAHGIDQIANLIHQLKSNPDSRRLIVSAWNPAEVDEMALPPCHCLFQFYTSPMSTSERSHYRYLNQNDGLYLEMNQFVHGLIDAQNEVGFSDAELARQVSQWHDEHGTPARKLSCQLYQR